MSGTLIIWIFTMRILMIVTSLVSYFINAPSLRLSMDRRRNSISSNPSQTCMDHLNRLHRCHLLGNYVLLSGMAGPLSGLWWALSIIISCGTAAVH